MEKKCEFCGKDLIGKQRRFCNNNCQMKWRYKNIPEVKAKYSEYAKKSYEKNRDNPEFKQKSKERLKAWIEKNRSHFNDLVREPNRLRSIKRREELKIKGLCTTCAGVRDIAGKLTCKKCYEKVKRYRDGKNKS